ncbi:MAG: cyclic pyranopterin monophosphate synthase MoaC [Anaerolineae bacterium]|nr:cyclic pyranopterin monophosphate synthase MoaC [Anaerolineae bacterium]
MAELTHLNAAGEVHMVDVGDKPDNHRVAEARGCIRMTVAAYEALVRGDLKKGDALGVARVAGIMAAKRTSELIPLCHPIALTKVDVRCEASRPNSDYGQVDIVARVECRGKTGVEMEALTAVSVAALTIYDMVKAIDRTMTIGNIELMHKSGGQRGDYHRNQ